MMVTLACTVSSNAAIAGLSCPDCQVVKVERVIDGDTLDSPVGRIRLYGVNTPERGEECFSEATERLEELAGDRVRVEPGPRRVDNYGRVLAYIYTETGASVDEILVRGG
jgi:micrococcal nuclease